MDLYEYMNKPKDLETNIEYGSRIVIVNNNKDECPFCHCGDMDISGVCIDCAAIPEKNYWYKDLYGFPEVKVNVHTIFREVKND